MPAPTTEQIRHRLVCDLLGSRIIENSLRGYWCEAMVAEALGSKCKLVSNGWHPWDIQIGGDQAKFPARVRIQVKNSARLQTWHTSANKPSDSLFNLKFSKRPGYFERDFPDVPCEEYGFMCDVFVLCHHPIETLELADQTDPAQWEFYIVPVVGNNIAVTSAEIEAAAEKLKTSGKGSYCQRRPDTLRKGIRGRPLISPEGIEGLTIGAIENALGVGVASKST
jgi:hypothetical protein